MTTHDEDDQNAAAAAPGPATLGKTLVISLEEANAAFGKMGGARSRGVVADLLREIITMGRKCDVVIMRDDQPRVPTRQYASLAEMEAAVAGNRYELMLEVIKAAGRAGMTPVEILGEMARLGRPWHRRSEVYPAIKRGCDARLVVQALRYGRVYWHEHAPRPRALPADVDRRHAGLGLPCDICPGACTIDDDEAGR